ncbi:MAG: DUF3568 family protein [Planctomycetota bacterium]
MNTLHARIVHVVIALSVVSLAILWGCGGGQTRQGTLYSIQPNRSLETYMPSDLETVHAAALEAVKTDFGFELGESAVDAAEGLVEARTALDHPVRIKMYKYGEQITRVEVYVGPRGSEVVARELLSAIETRLTGSPAPGK